MKNVIRPFASIAASANTQISLKQSKENIAKRIVCVQLGLTRWALEMSKLNHKDENQHLKSNEAFNALRKAMDHVPEKWWTKREQSLMDSSLGSWDPSRDLYSLDMRWESFGMLLWACRIFKDVPTYDGFFPRERAYTSTAIIPAVPSTIDTFVTYFTSGEGSTSPDHFITDAELLEQIQIGEAWLWRARAQRVLNLKEDLALQTEEVRTEQLKKIPKALKTVMDQIEDAIAMGSERAKETGLITDIVNNDFGVLDGKMAYKDVDDHQLRDFARLTESRVNCLGWMVGKSDFDYKEGEVAFINPMGSIWAPEE